MKKANKTGLALATAAAVIFVSGCATSGCGAAMAGAKSHMSKNSCSGKNACKGKNSCKGKNGCNGKH